MITIACTKEGIMIYMVKLKSSTRLVVWRYTIILYENGAFILNLMSKEIEALK